MGSEPIKFLGYTCAESGLKTEVRMIPFIALVTVLYVGFLLAAKLEA